MDRKVFFMSPSRREKRLEKVFLSLGCITANQPVFRRGPFLFIYLSSKAGHSLTEKMVIFQKYKQWCHCFPSQWHEQHLWAQCRLHTVMSYFHALVVRIERECAKGRNYYSAPTTVEIRGFRKGCWDSKH